MKKTKNEILHENICKPAKESNDLDTWIQYGCDDCKEKLKKALEKYAEIVEISNKADIRTEASDTIKEELELSESIHGKGIYHPLIGYMFRDEIISREIRKIKDKSFRELVISFWLRDVKIRNDVWSRR